MPLVKYRTDNDKVSEVMVDSNITVSGFMELVSDKSKKDITQSIFRGKVLENDDLVRNYITGPDQVLILLTNNSIKSEDVMDLEEEIKENKKKKIVENTVSSTFLRRIENNQNRKGIKYTFTIFTTATSESMFHGNKIDFSLRDNYSTVYNEIEKLVKNFRQIEYNQFKLYIFLPGGVYFKSGTLSDYYINPDNIAYDNLYVIVIPKVKKSYKIEDPIKDPCSCSNSQRNEILSPYCKSSKSGLTQIASFLGYMYYGGPKSEHILLSLAKITRFAPLIVNLYRLIENRSLNVLNILAITAPLFTLFKSMMPTQIKNENIFEYTLNFLSVFDVITDIDYLKFFELSEVNETDCDEVKLLGEYCEKTEQQDHLIIWTADTLNPDFQAVVMKPNFSTIENIFSTVTTFKPVAPLSLHYIFYPTFILGEEEKSVILFIKEVPNKENIVTIIDPTESGSKIEINIEDLAKKLNCNKKDDIFSLIDPTKVDQIIFICFDESFSMKWKLEGGNARNDEKTRSFIATEFLKALIKQSYALRVSSFYGLISFSSEVKILQPLTAMTSDFISKLKEINPKGKTLLYDAINIAQQQICELCKKLSFPNSRLRIIVITDGADNKSEKPPVTLINELIKNEIVVDSVLVSLVDKSSGCCSISKLTGGLCFMPKNIEEGIEIFKQEAFLNIKTRHMKPLLYNNITKEIFNKITENYDSYKQEQYDSYSPNQMIINANSKVSLATPKYMSYLSTQKRIKTYRIMRSFIELNIISRNKYDSSFIVYSLYSTPEEWRIFIKGPKNTPFYNKWLNLYMVIPSNYPIEPPKFRFLTIPFHPNVSSEGTVLFNLNDRDYSSSLGIDSIILGIINLLIKPDLNNPLNQKAMELYLNNKKEFKKKQKEEGEIGCNNYQEYLKDVKIYSEIPKDVIVPDEDRNPTNLLSITANAINEAVLKGKEIIPKNLLDINDYELINRLGHGGFADVYLVIEKTTNFQFAAKIPREESEIDYIKEVNVISNFNHGAISKLYGYCLQDFNKNNRCVIIMEYLPNGDLRDVIDEEKKHNKRKGWDLTQKLITIYGIAHAMAYSVSFGITHSDLKPQNILMTNKLFPKITDFDTARIKSEGNTQSFNSTGNEAFTPLYTAPEIADDIEGWRNKPEKCDVYSFAIIVFEIITALDPFPRMRPVRILCEIASGTRPEIPYDVPLHIQELIEACWSRYPDLRPTFSEIVDILKSDSFLEDIDIDSKRFKDYINYIDNYKDSITDSKYIKPISKADKDLIKNEDDPVLKIKDLNIINLRIFIKEDSIGFGKYCKAYKIKNTKNGKVFAAKISNKINDNFYQEVSIMKNLNYPSIIKFIGYSSFNFEKERKPTIITEFALNGSLQNLIDNIDKIPKWNNTKRLIVIFGIAAGMAYLHNNNIIHNDLKPSNVLLDEKFYPKIADFGLAQSTENYEKITDVKGTPSFIAPEIWSDQIYNEATDVYAFAILIYELVFLKKAFYGMKHVQIAYKVAQNQRPEFPNDSKYLDQFRPIITRCWSQDPNKRPSFKQLMVEFKDKKYLTDDVDKGEFSKYVQLIEGFK